MSRELYFPFRKPKTSHGLRNKHLLPSAMLLTAHCPWKGFEENQRALDKTPCWNKEKWQWLTGWNNARLKRHLRIKWQEKPGGNLTKIACCLRKEPRQTCHLFTQSTGFRLSASHIDRASWKKTKNKKKHFFSYEHRSFHTTVWRLNWLLFSAFHPDRLAWELGDGMGSAGSGTSNGEWWLSFSPSCASVVCRLLWAKGNFSFRLKRNSCPSL